MKKKPGFNLRTICGERIIVAEGKENIDFIKSHANIVEKAAEEEKAADAE